MEIKRESVNELNAVLTIKLEPSDYQSKFEDALKKYRKQASMPGFRPGNVPMSVIRKRFGKSILADEINNLINDSIYQHINENKLNILGNPLPKADGEEVGDWDNPSDFSFQYEVGLAPAIDLEKVRKQKIEYYTVNVDDKLVDRQISDMARRYGALSEPETSDENDLLLVTLVQLDENGEILEGGIMRDATISLEFLEDKKTRKELTGLKSGDSVVVDPHKISNGHDDLGRMLGITHEEVHHLKGNFKLNVNEIKRLTPAEINQELFDKAYGKDAIADLDAFKARVKQDLEKMFEADAHRLFKRRVATAVVENLNPALPDEFLKRWITMTNENPLSEEELNAEYPGYAKGLQWQLIENAVVREKEIKVDQQEIIDYVKGNLARQYAQYGMPLDDETLQQFAMNSLQNRDEVNRVYEMLLEDKVVNVLKEEMKVSEKALGYEDFVKEAQKTA